MQARSVVLTVLAAGLMLTTTSCGGSDDSGTTTTSEVEVEVEVDSTVPTTLDPRDGRRALPPTTERRGSTRIDPNNDVGDGEGSSSDPAESETDEPAGPTTVPLPQ